MGYLWPVRHDRNRVSTWQAHRNRSTPSTEPGEDLFVPIGTPVLAPADAVVADTGDSIAGATGRFVTLDFDDGRRFRALHLSRRVVSRGQRVRRGDLIAYSGASGYGEEDWSWNVAETGGAHVHITLWRTQRYVFGSDATLDPQYFFTDMPAGLAGGNATPFEEDDMPYSQGELEQFARNALFDILNSPPPPGGWPFQKQQAAEVWGAPLPAQDAAGNLTGQAYTAAGYLASTNARVGGQLVDVDEKAIAAELAPLLAAHPAEVIARLSDEDVARFARAAADEDDRRERARLGQG